MSVPTNANVKEDSVLAFLAKAQIWFSENWKWLAVIVLIGMIAFALISEKSRKEAIAEERAYWESAAKANTPEKREQFLKSNPETQAAKLLSLQLTRQYLDDGKFKEALTTISTFVEKNPKSPMLSIALMLKAYAHEELDENDKALSAYKEVEAVGDMMAVLSQQNIKRLEKSSSN